VAHALNRHVVLIGFMGAGKSTLGAEVARRLGRPFRDVDAEIEEAHGPIAELFAERGEAGFREIEAQFVTDACTQRKLSVVAVGGGAVETPGLLEALGALVVLVDVDVETAWERARETGRPLAQDEANFRRLYERRRPLYVRVAQARANDVDGVVLAAAGICFGLHRDVRGDGVVADEHVAELHAIEANHRVPGGEKAKTVSEAMRLWRGLRLERSSTVVAVGGGTTTDLVGFVAATYLRGVAWTPVPSTLVGMVDAAIGGKTGIDLPDMKNAVGAFHWPSETVIDTSLLESLPEQEWANGRAEVVKTGLLAGEPFWELEQNEMIRRCAAYKGAVCLRDPRDRGERAQLNLGHTFAHALEVASGFQLPHGRAVALGLSAALMLSGLGEELRLVEDVLRPEPVAVDRNIAWTALLRDKKAKAGTPRLVLLDAPGEPRHGVEVDSRELRAALDALIA
jgi:shikimate kinase/3-dehydroquinate synthase